MFCVFYCHDTHTTLTILDYQYSHHSVVSVLRLPSDWVVINRRGVDNIHIAPQFHPICSLSTTTGHSLSLSLRLSGFQIIWPMPTVGLSRRLCFSYTGNIYIYIYVCVCVSIYIYIYMWICIYIYNIYIYISWKLDAWFFIKTLSFQSSHLSQMF